MRDSGPIDLDVLFITESKEFLTGELSAVVHDDEVRYSKAMDDIKEEPHGLLRLDREYRSGLYRLYKLVYGDKQVRIAPERPLERSDQIEPPDHERPRDGDCLEHLDQ